MSPALVPDTPNKIEDLSGATVEPGENPFTALIQACGDDHAQIQVVYSTHRTKRNSQKRAEFLENFNGVLVDPYLLRLEQDHRHCLVFWARPPDHVLLLASRVQNMLKEIAPSLWLMPTHRMHMTTLEITHSREPGEISSLVATMKATMPALTNYTFSHRCRLVKPIISYDLAAIALSFLPASGEPAASARAHGVADGYTYHHLRRDAFDLARSAGVNISSRYIVPSAHITLGRYLVQDEHDTTEKRMKWVQTIDHVNEWLQEVGCEWIVGEEKGLDARDGTLWFGGGRSIMQGEGF